MEAIMSVPLKQFAITKRSEAYWRITFNNPPLNLLNPETIRELKHLMELVEAQSDLRVAVFDSANPDFYFARYDLARAAETPTEPGPTGFPAWIDFLLRIAQTPVISIASIRGRTRGGGSELALSFDMRFASKEKAIFGQPEVAGGVLPGGGANERLPQLMGRARALEVIIGSDDFDAETAERYGWINRCLPDHELDGFVDNLARRIASFDGQAIAEAKRLVNRSVLPQPRDFLESQTAFLAAARWPQVLPRVLKARERAAKVGLDFELRLGHHLGNL
jgi:enoyl-CoA hydratase/carnithine racemase